MTALYEIANDFAKLSNEDLDPELIADTIEGIEGQFSDKVEQLLAIIKNKNADAVALKAEAKKLTERAKAAESAVTRIKEYVASSMHTMDKKTVSAGVHTVTIRKPGMKLVVADASKLPVDMVDIETIFKPKSADIKRAIKAGEKVEGATLEAGKESILIK